jgi:hypothetical protein
MATKAWVSKQRRREELVQRYADIRRQLKKEKNYAALAKLPRDSSPTRSHLRLAPAVRDHRAVQGQLPQIQDLPHHAPRAGFGRQDPGPAEGELVRKEVPSAKA